MSRQEPSCVTAAAPQKRYTLVKTIGEGAFGVVYKAHDRISGRVVAIKKARANSMARGVPASTLREVQCLKELRHPAIVSCVRCLLDVVYTTEKLYLVFEYCEQDLKTYIDTLQEDLSPYMLQSILRQLLEGIHFCHCRRVMHRDLKPQNLLIDKNGNLKIADFGLGRAFTLPMKAYTHEVVTLWYRPPEILLGATKYSPAVDIWGIGCIFAEMAMKTPLFPGCSEIDQLFQTFRICGTPTDKNWPGVSKLPDYTYSFPRWLGSGIEAAVPKLSPVGMDLLKRMLVCHPSQRITAREALKHPFFFEPEDVCDMEICDA